MDIKFCLEDVDIMLCVKFCLEDVDIMLCVKFGLEDVDIMLCVKFCLGGKFVVEFCVGSADITF